ncbi:MAG: acetate--CoA ligase family protein, partial [Acidimicrobiales bacterium]
MLVVTDGGGDSVLALDALSDAGVPLARLDPATAGTLDALSPPAAPRAAGANPVTLDTAGGLEEDPRLLARCAEVGAADPGVGTVVVAGTFGGYRERRAQELEAVDALVAVRDGGTPVLVHSAFALDDEEPVRRLRAAGVPVFPTVLRLAAALGRPGVRDASSKAPPGDAAGRLLPTLEAAALLRSAGVRLPPLRIVRTPEDLGGIPSALCLKVEDPAIAHKSDAGGVVLGMEAAEAAALLWERFPGRPLLAMPVLAAGLEVLVGAGQDPTWGPFVTVGRGGVTAELDPDVALAPAPLSPGRAAALWRSLRCAPLLEGWRGRPGVEVDALAGLAAALGDLAAADPSLT